MSRDEELLQREDIARRLLSIESKIDNQVIREIERLKSDVTVARDNSLLLGSIASKLDSIASITATGFKDIKDVSTKVILALIGLTAASIGVKIVGSPVWLDIYVFMAVLALSFVILESIRKKIWFRLFSGIGFSLYILFSVLSPGYGRVQNLPLLSLLSLAAFGGGILFLMLSTWIGKVDK